MRSRQWEKRSSKEKSRRTDGDGKGALVTGPSHSAPNPNPTDTPAPAKFKLGKQPVWTAYASPNVAERWRKELQNNARATAVTRRKRRAAEEPELWVHRMSRVDNTSTINESSGYWKSRGGAVEEEAWARIQKSGVDKRVVQRNGRERGYHGGCDLRREAAARASFTRTTDEEGEGEGGGGGGIGGVGGKLESWELGKARLRLPNLPGRDTPIPRDYSGSCPWPARLPVKIPHISSRHPGAVRAAPSGRIMKEGGETVGVGCSTMSVTVDETSHNYRISMILEPVDAALSQIHLKIKQISHSWQPGIPRACLAGKQIRGGGESGGARAGHRELGPRVRRIGEKQMPHQYGGRVTIRSGGFTQRGPVWRRTPWPNKQGDEHFAIAYLNGNVLARQNNMTNIDDIETDAVANAASGTKSRRRMDALRWATCSTVQCAKFGRPFEGWVGVTQGDNGTWGDVSASSVVG
ncbi:hypothetical protein B0H13DRAFT_2406396 [Mycena leptocephala]|nr:hypothetical protein B0H13DRAFT_2406396 [Mycena leptocephala]